MKQLDKPGYTFTGKKLSVLGISVMEGQDIQGVEEAPKYLREAGLITCLKDLEWDIKDLGEITSKTVEDRIEEFKKKPSEGFKCKVRDEEVIGAVNERIAQICHEETKNGRFMLNLGGDHGLASGTITGSRRTYPNLKLIWFDAHGDCNTPEISPSGNYHGMPAAHVFGWIKNTDLKCFEWVDVNIAPENVVFIGLRDLDKGEKDLLTKHGIKYYTPYDIENVGGIKYVMDETLNYLQCNQGQNNPVHISWDVDGCDPSYIYGTGTKSRIGVSERESHYILQRVANTGNLVSLDMVEINPYLEKEAHRAHFHGDNPNIKGSPSVANGVELILSALGFSWRY